MTTATQYPWRRERSSRRRALGIGIVEIMIALTLGLVVIGALGQLYVGSVKSHQLSYNLAQLGESGRFAVDLLASELRMAGYLSCGGSSARVANALDGDDHWLYQTGAIDGYEGGVDSLPAELIGQVRANTDLLILRRASSDQAQSVVSDDPANAVMELGLDHGFQPGEILVISNPSCVQASIFQVTGLRNIGNPQAPSLFDAIEHDANVSLTPGNCSADLFGAYDCSTPEGAVPGSFSTGSMVGRFLVAAYYVSSDDPPTLVRQRLSVQNGQAAVVTDVLVRNVEDFQVLYGRDTDPDGSHSVDDYVTADQVTDWGQVVSVSFGLLVRSRDDGIRTEASAQAFPLPGRTVIAPADRHLRRSFGSVVALRNNLP